MDKANPNVVAAGNVVMVVGFMVFCYQTVKLVARAKRGVV